MRENNMKYVGAVMMENLGMDERAKATGIRSAKRDQGYTNIVRVFLEWGHPRLQSSAPMAASAARWVKDMMICPSQCI